MRHVIDDSVIREELALSEPLVDIDHLVQAHNTSEGGVDDVDDAFWESDLSTTTTTAQGRVLDDERITPDLSPDFSGGTPTQAAEVVNEIEEAKEEAASNGKRRLKRFGRLPPNHPLLLQGEEPLTDSPDNANAATWMSNY